LVAIGEQSQREQDKMFDALMDSAEFEFTFEEGHHHPVLSQITLNPETVQEMIDFREPDHDHDDSSSVTAESTRNAESDPAELVPESDSEFESVEPIDPAMDGVPPPLSDSWDDLMDWDDLGEDIEVVEWPKIGQE